MFKKIYVEITNVCNLNCIFCPKTNRPPEFMKTSFFERIIKQINGLSKYLCFHIMGEPLLHPDLDCLLDIAGKNNFQVNLTTNGALLKKNAEKILGKKALRQVNISLHSFSANNNNFLIEYLNDVFEFIDKSKKHKGLKISLRLWNLVKNNDTSGVVKFSKNENAVIIENIEKHYNLKYKIEDVITMNGLKIAPEIYLNYAEQFEWPDINGEIINERGFCLGLREQIAIFVNGIVTPCCLDRDGVIALGDITKNTLYEIINNNRAKEIFDGFSNRLVVEELCKKCGYRQRFNTRFESK